MGWCEGSKLRVVIIIIGFIMVEEFIWRLRRLSAIMGRAGIVGDGFCVSSQWAGGRSFTRTKTTLFTMQHCPLISVLNPIKSCPKMKSIGSYLPSVPKGRIAYRIQLKLVYYICSFFIF